MRCKKIERLLSDYVDGTLDAPAKGAVEKHLASCRDCAFLLKRLERTVMLVKNAPIPRPPEYYWNDFAPRLMDRLRREEEEREAWRPWFGELFGGRRQAVAFASAAAMAVAAGAFLVHEKPMRMGAAVRTGGARGAEETPYVAAPRPSIRAIDSADTRLAGMPAQGVAPFQMAREMHPLVIESVEQARGWLGIGVQNLTPALQTEFGIADGHGVVVAMVVDSGPARRAGIKEGDVIRSFAGETIESPHELIALVAQSDVGAKVPLVIVRDGKERTVDVTIGTRTERGEGREAGLGLVLEEITPQLALRFNMSAPPRGLLVADVRPGGPASRAGFRRGDVIMDVNRRPVAGLAAWEALVKEAKPGQKFLVRTQRGFFVIRAD